MNYFVNYILKYLLLLQTYDNLLTCFLELYFNIFGFFNCSEADSKAGYILDRSQMKELWAGW